MALPNLVIGKPKDDTSRMGLATPTARTGPSDILVPKPPSKRPEANAPRPGPDDTTADFAIICEGGTLRAHKSVLVAACPYFERMFRFDGKENRDKQVEMNGVSHRSMKCTLHFIYSGRYDFANGEIVPSTGYCNHDHAGFDKDKPQRARIFKRKCPCAGSTVSPSHLLPHICVYAIADYLDMPSLKAFARQGVINILHVCWNDARLDIKAALEMAFSNTPDGDRGLRQVLVDTLVGHPSLWVDDGGVGYWLDEHPEVLNEVDDGKDLPPYRLTFNG